MKKIFIVFLLLIIISSCKEDDYSAMEVNYQEEVIALGEVCNSVSLDNALLLRSLAEKYSITFQHKNTYDNFPEITKQFVERLLKSDSVVASRSLNNNYESMNVFKEDESTGTCLTYIDSYFSLGIECLVYLAVNYGYKTDIHNYKTIWYCDIGQLGVVNLQKEKGYEPYWESEYCNITGLTNNSIICVVKGTLKCRFNVEGYRGTIELKDIYSHVIIEPLQALQKETEDEFWGTKD